MGLQVTKWVEVETEVIVHVSASDIASALTGEADSVRAALTCLNSVACFMRALPDEIVTQMTGEQRALVYDFLHKQSQRFGAPPAEE